MGEEGASGPGGRSVRLTGFGAGGLGRRQWRGLTVRLCVTLSETLV